VAPLSNVEHHREGREKRTPQQDGDDHRLLLQALVGGSSRRSPSRSSRLERVHRNAGRGTIHTRLPFSHRHKPPSQVIEGLDES